MWIHINFNFKKRNAAHRTNKYLINSQREKFYKLLRQVLSVNAWNIKRKFFLYEPNPHCFLALEIKKSAKVSAINIVKLCKRKRLSFIRDVSYKLNCKDDGNGDYFINCLSAFTDVTLTLAKFYPYWLKKFPIKDLRQHAHIIHCCINQATSSRPLERRFYKAMYRTYRCK